MNVWIIPSNLKNFDVIGAFRRFKKIDWKQSTHVEVGDTVFIYVAAPIGAIMYRCVVNKTELAEREIDDSAFFRDGTPYVGYGRYMELELQDCYDVNRFCLGTLKDNGLKGNIQGPRKAEGELRKLLME